MADWSVELSTLIGQPRTAVGIKNVVPFLATPKRGRTMNGTHAFATTEVVAQRREKSASSTADAEPRTGFEANLRFRTGGDERRTEADEPRAEGGGS